MEVDDPRLAPGLRELEKLKQDHFGEGKGRISIIKGANFISRVAGESGQYLLGASRIAKLTDSRPKCSVHVELPDPNHFVVWNSVWFVAQNLKPITMFDMTGKKVKDSQQIALVEPGRHLYTTLKGVYFRNRGHVISLDRKLKEATVYQTPGDIQDFFVCPKTETITTLEWEKLKFFLRQGSHELQIPKSTPSSRSSLLKKMYSDHFLVGETNSDFESGRLHLVRAVPPKRYHFIKTPNKLDSSIQNIRLLAPRQGISCFLVAMSRTLELFCEYRLKLYHLKTLEINLVPKCLSHHSFGLWMVAGKNYAILSVRVDFSKCPALQL